MKNPKLFYFFWLVFSALLPVGSICIIFGFLVFRTHFDVLVIIGLTICFISLIFLLLARSQKRKQIAAYYEKILNTQKERIAPVELTETGERQEYE